MWAAECLFHPGLLSFLFERISTHVDSLKRKGAAVIYKMISAIKDAEIMEPEEDVSTAVISNVTVGKKSFNFSDVTFSADERDNDVISICMYKIFTSDLIAYLRTPLGKVRY